MRSQTLWLSPSLPEICCPLLRPKDGQTPAMSQAWGESKPPTGHPSGKLVRKQPQHPSLATAREACGPAQCLPVCTGPTKVGQMIGSLSALWQPIRIRNSLVKAPCFGTPVICPLTLLLRLLWELKQGGCLCSRSHHDRLCSVPSKAFPLQGPIMCACTRSHTPFVVVKLSCSLS